MELVYLWVEDYKNIKKQGFNFSPRFECEFKYEYEQYIDEEGSKKERLKDNCELIICDKKKKECKDNDYIENFFGDNINVTAIVGKNGSGKSTIIDCIDRIFSDRTHNGEEWIFNFLFILKDNENNLTYVSSFKINTEIENKGNYHNLEYYMYLANEQKSWNEDLNESIVRRIFLNDIIISMMITDNYVSSVDFKLTTFMYIPHKIEIKPISFALMWQLVLKKSEGEFYLDFFRDGLSDREEEKFRKDARNQAFAREDNLSDLYENLHDDFHKFLVIRHIKDYGYDDNNNQLEDKDFLIKEFNELEDSFSEVEYYSFFMEKTKLAKEFSKRDKEIYFKYYKDYFEFDFIDSENRRYKNLSHGEQTIFGQLLNIYYYSKNSFSKAIIFLLDEVELSLHPQWQKMYLFELQTLLGQINSKYHIIITTHSPFLLSDIPKQNIIFLDKDEKGNCRVVDGLKEKKQTFGANIHTLLSDSFFMENGLMGEFAKGKIDKVITLLNQEKLSDKDLKYCEQIISIIGEPIVKNQLQKMLDSKRLKKVDEIDKIYEEIELLKHRIEILRKD